MVETKPDYYRVLGLGHEASALEIKTAFEKLVSDFHSAGKPKNINDAEEIRQYVRAHRILSDPQKREYYDRTGLNPVEADFAGGMQPIPDAVGSIGTASDVASLILDAADIVIDLS
jgi:DnaJ-class molecular chaperone